MIDINTNMPSKSKIKMLRKLINRNVKYFRYFRNINYDVRSCFNKNISGQICNNDVLSFRGMELKSIPKISSNIKILDVSDNQITKLTTNTLPNTLIALNCSYNLIKNHCTSIDMI